MIVSDVIVGLQHGDEGKGKVSYNMSYASKYDYCIRFNGGPNAGHTIITRNDVIIPNVKVVLHQIPCGILNNAQCIIGPGCVVDLDKLENEILYLESLGFSNTRSNLRIARNAHIITKEHIELDTKNNSVGTTGCGIGPCYTDKYRRKGTRCIDQQEVIESMNIEMIDCKTYFIKHLTSSPVTTVLFEGAQGFNLDIDHGDYPYVTSSSCLVGMINNCGIPVTTLRNVIGTAKIYETYVGSKQFQLEGDIDLDNLGKMGGEFGATTGRKRQCNWFYMNNLIESLAINGVNHLIINKCDIIRKLNIYRLYDTNNNLVDFANYTDLKEYIQTTVQHLFPTTLITFSYSPTEI